MSEMGNGETLSWTDKLVKILVPLGQPISTVKNKRLSVKFTLKCMYSCEFSGLDLLWIL